MNCQGLTIDKINYITIEYIVNNENLKFLCLTEIWYDSRKFKVFENFNMSSSYIRKNFIRGGVGIWSRSNQKVKALNLDEFCSEKNIEICGIQYKHKSKIKTIILNCYRSPSGNFNSFCKNIAAALDFVTKPDVDIVLVGDINLDPERDSKESKILNGILSTYNIKNIINKPTRKIYTLDHIYINNFTSFTVLDNDISDHRSILLDFLDISKSASGNQTIFKRKFNDSNIEKFCNDIKNENWTEVYNETDADNCFNVFYNIFMLYFNKHFPIKKYILREEKNGLIWKSEILVLI